MVRLQDGLRLPRDVLDHAPRPGGGFFEEVPGQQRNFLGPFPLVAEEFAFQKPLRYGRAIHRHKSGKEDE